MVFVCVCVLVYVSVWCVAELLCMMSSPVSRRQECTIIAVDWAARTAT